MNTIHPPGILGRLAHKRNAAAESRYKRTISAYLCLVDLKSQRGEEADWHTVLHRVAFGLALAREFFNAETVAELHRALTILSQIHSSVPGRANLWYVTSREAAILGPVLRLTDEMEVLCNRQEIVRANQVARQYLAF